MIYGLCFDHWPQRVSLFKSFKTTSWAYNSPQQSAVIYNTLHHKLTNHRCWRSKPLEDHLKPPACPNTRIPFFSSFFTHSLPLPVSPCQLHSQRNKYIWAYFQPPGRLMNPLKASVAKEERLHKLSLLLSQFVSCSLRSTQHEALSRLTSNFTHNCLKIIRRNLQKKGRSGKTPTCDSFSNRTLYF